MLQAKLDPEHDVLILDLILPRRPRAHALPAAGLVCVFAAGVELAVAVAGDVEVVVGELGALVVEGGGVGDHLLEVGGEDLVGGWFVVDGV